MKLHLWGPFAALAMFIACLPAAADDKGPAGKIPPDFDKEIAEALGKALTKTLEEIFEKYGLQADDRALLKIVGKFAPKDFKKFSRLTISVIRPFGTPAINKPWFEVTIEPFTLRFNRFFCEVPRPIAVVSYGIVQGKRMATSEVLFVYDQAKGVWEPKGK
jgi:hypothetical protein